MSRNLYISWVLIAGLYLPAADLFAQNSSQRERFEVNYDRGCSPLKVIINETDTFPDDVVIQYDFEGDGVFIGFEPDEEISFIYDSTGNHTIVQLVGLDNIPKTDSINIEVLNPEIPEFKVLTCEGQAATLVIQSDQYEQYRIFFTPSDSTTIFQGDPIPEYSYPAGTHQIIVKGLFLNAKENCGISSETFQTINNLSAGRIDDIYLTETDQTNGKVELGLTLIPDVVYQLDVAINLPSGFVPIDLVQYPEYAYSIDNLNTTDNTYIYRVSAFDACQGKYIYSDTLSTVRLNVQAENSRNRLDWDIYPLKFQAYEISKDGQVLVTLDQENANFYIDLGIECGQDYCYSVAFRNTNGATSYSDTVCVTAYSVYFPPAIRNTSASVNGEYVDLSWISPTGLNEIQKYFIQLQTGDDIYSTIDTTLSTSYTHDTEDIIDDKICYRVNYVDECDNRSNLGALTCTMFLTNPEEDLFKWTSYTGWNSGVSTYFLETLDEEGDLLRQLSTRQNTSFTDPEYYKTQVERYSVFAVPDDPELDTVYSNSFLKILDGNLFIPTAFTPDRDGLNDIFITKGTEMMKFRLRVFTRHGSLIFESEDQSRGWDGSLDGKELPFGSYIFEVQATDFFEKEYKRTGTVILIK
ncbi:T9SS type B sorting domain-containing protein [Bacteroidota bacterium]